MKTAIIAYSNVLSVAKTAVGAYDQIKCEIDQELIAYKIDFDSKYEQLDVIKVIRSPS